MIKTGKQKLYRVDQESQSRHTACNSNNPLTIVITQVTSGREH